jgi:hypothetical protein
MARHLVPQRTAQSTERSAIGLMEEVCRSKQLFALVFVKAQRGCCRKPSNHCCLQIPFFVLSLAAGGHLCNRRQAMHFSSLGNPHLSSLMPSFLRSPSARMVVNFARASGQILPLACCAPHIIDINFPSSFSLFQTSLIDLHLDIAELSPVLLLAEISSPSQWVNLRSRHQMPSSISHMLPSCTSDSYRIFTILNRWLTFHQNLWLLHRLAPSASNKGRIFVEQQDAEGQVLHKGINF